jgi:hypothetical protein
LLVRGSTNDGDSRRRAKDPLDLVVLGDRDQAPVLLEVEVVDRPTPGLEPCGRVAIVGQLAPSLT